MKRACIRDKERKRTVLSVREGSRATVLLVDDGPCGRTGLLLFLESLPNNNNATFSFSSFVIIHTLFSSNFDSKCFFLFL